MIDQSLLTNTYSLSSDSHLMELIVISSALFMIRPIIKDAILLWLWLVDMNFEMILRSYSRLLVSLWFSNFQSTLRWIALSSQTGRDENSRFLLKFLFDYSRSANATSQFASFTSCKTLDVLKIWILTLRCINLMTE